MGNRVNEIASQVKKSSSVATWVFWTGKHDKI